MINYLGTPKIETDRLILRRLEPTDAQSMFDHWLSDERVTDNLIKGAHKTVSETFEWVDGIVREYSSKEFCDWGIEIKTTGELIGEIELYNFDIPTENCEVGYSLGCRWWHQGYGTEALRAVVEFGFRYMNIHKISAAHNIDNAASGRIMSKVGMAQEGMIRHKIRNAKNQYKDCAVYGILQEDYLKNTVSTPTYILNLE
ncbi:GNAT family N-acetyltransferase [Fictibacillus enclensis]|uniref:GNAT family N-acetyltransferase n=1 Tax=Fictibacillus enclensis TaxID=1017270 RepID=UPI0024BF2437|nr:GNAT family N-acetyltransferase [Fictibacillus enclensis]MDM5335903.1 GNAT family N-acetyltransferase [Fictibacillus enclensis]WHY71219.1 GNAT family N-acetyltransferase [Fictibacillus enclensis]